MTEWLGWEAALLDNGIVRAAVTPDLGGRVLQFWLGDHPFLFVNPSLLGQLFTPDQLCGDGTFVSWKNYGGNKTWLSPLGPEGPDTNPGPPDPVLDGRFSLLAAGALTASMESGTDPRSGVRITRALTLDPYSARASLRREMHNVSDRTVRWGLWDVTQVDCAWTVKDGPTEFRPGSTVYTPLNPTSRFEGGYQIAFGAPDSAQWRRVDDGLLAVDSLGDLGKVGLDSVDGWIAFHDAREGWVLVHQFSYDAEAEYPHGGDTVEILTMGAGRVGEIDFADPRLLRQYVEMEVLDPLVSLDPGQRQAMTIEWGACRCPTPIRRVNTAGCVAQPLTLEPDGQALRARGAFGVFAPGLVQLRLGPPESGDAVALGEWPTGPFEPLLLNHPIAATNPNAVHLVSLDRRGHSRGVLDNWTAGV